LQRQLERRAARLTQVAAIEPVAARAARAALFLTQFSVQIRAGSIRSGVSLLMKALLPAGLLILVAAGAVEARPAERVPGRPDPVLAPLEQAATDCFADTVMANPKAQTLARGGRWYEAAGVIGFLCRPEVARMIQAHDRAYGRGTGERFFAGSYARHLDRQLAVRLRPLLERETYASAEPPLAQGHEDGIAIVPAAQVEAPAR